MANVILPVAKCVYVCDDVIGNPTSGKPTSVNLWDTIRFPLNAAFPYRLNKVCVFVWWRGGIRPVRSWVEIVQGSSGQLVRRSKDYTLDFRERGFSVYARYALEGCLLPEPGIYFVEVFCEGIFVDDQVIRLLPK